MVLDMAFCVTWAYWLQLMGFQYRGSVASCALYNGCVKALVCVVWYPAVCIER
jgi:hypothetical protein